MLLLMPRPAPKRSQVCLDELGWQKKEPARTRASRPVSSSFSCSSAKETQHLDQTSLPFSKFEKETWCSCLYGACRDLCRLTQGHPYHLAFVEIMLSLLRHLTSGAALLKVVFCLLAPQAH